MNYEILKKYKPGPCKSCNDKTPTPKDLPEGIHTFRCGCGLGIKKVLTTNIGEIEL